MNNYFACLEYEALSLAHKNRVVCSFPSREDAVRFLRTYADKSQLISADTDPASCVLKIVGIEDIEHGAAFDTVTSSLTKWGQVSGATYAVDELGIYSLCHGRYVSSAIDKRDAMAKEAITKGVLRTNCNKWIKSSAQMIADQRRTKSDTDNTDYSTAFFWITNLSGSNATPVTSPKDFDQCASKLT
jgi:threonine dehydrogenase-like Zn-dependent dehydrogenase